MGMKRREHFSAWENSPGDFIILIISAEVWNTENNKNGKIQKVRLIELYYPSEMCSWMFLKLKMSSIKDIVPLLYLIFPVVIAREARVEAESLSYTFNWISLSHQASKWQNVSVKWEVPCFSHDIGMKKQQKWHRDLLSDQPFKSHTSHVDNLLHGFHRPLGEGG